METLTITLPASLHDFVDQQVVQRGLSSPSDLMLELLDNERQGMEAMARLLENKSRLEELLLEGLASGPPAEMTADWWDEKERSLLERLNQGAAK
jgi:antitoxin ParD1/3/4